MARSPVPDIRLVQNLEFPKYSVTIDWTLLDDGTLDDKQALATAAIIALGTNALAAVDDQLPDPDSNDRQGWWGDYECQDIWPGSWPVGSKLWLLKRAAIEGPNFQRGSTVARVKSYIIQAMQPFVDNRICSRFTCDAFRQTDQQINAIVRMFRGPLPAIELRYAILWQEQQADGDLGYAVGYPDLT